MRGMTQLPRIGVCGLGLMGRGIAANYVKKGWPTVVWNRTAAAAQAIAGAEVAPSPRALAAEVDYVVTSLSTPAAVEAVGAELLAGARAGLRWIETSTIGSEASLRLAAAAAARGVAYLEAPVTGSKNGARDGTLVVMTGGPAELHAECEPVIAAFAARIIHTGPVGAAAVVKLVGNTIITFMLEGLAEGAVLARRAGVPLDKLLEVVQASGFASPYWAFKGGAMARRDFETHFSLELLHKDQALALREGALRGVPLPGLAACHQVTASARALGHADKDIAAQLLAVEAAAGEPESR